MDYLCTRSEFFRMLDLDTGIKPLFIRPPEGFIDHFDKVLPFSTEWTDDISRIRDDETFNMMVMWPESGKELEYGDIEPFIKRIEEGGSLWIALSGITPAQDGSTPVSYNGMKLDTSHILLCIEFDLYKVDLGK